METPRCASQLFRAGKWPASHERQEQHLHHKATANHITLKKVMKGHVPQRKGCHLSISWAKSSGEFQYRLFPLKIKKSKFMF